MTALSAEERLIVALDLKPHESGKREESKRDVLELAAHFARTGVFIKVNSSLRAMGYDLMDNIHAHGLKVFADLKLYDIGETLATDGQFLKTAKPDILTVACQSGIEAMRRIKGELPDTQIFGVAVLTTIGQKEISDTYDCEIIDLMLREADRGAEAGIDGMICSPAEVSELRTRFGAQFQYVTPGIRPEWSTVAGDDQDRARIMTPQKALAAGSDRLVVGRPITQAPDRMKALLSTLGEIRTSSS